MGRTRSRKRIYFILGLLVVVVLAGLLFLVNRKAESIASPYSGAYELDDGRLVFVSSRTAESLRYRLMSGKSGALWPKDGQTYTAGPGWSEKEPAEVVVTFEPLGQGTPPGLSWEQDGSQQRAGRLNLPEKEGYFESHGLSLRAKLVLPKGPGPFPAVVFVHGSEKDSAVDSYFNPYMFAAQGIAGLVYDKRGTGGSEGKYNQNFYLLSDDTVAAVEWLRSQPEIDGTDIHLAGYSQGGWIAPLAATKTSVRSLLINFGPMVPVTEEDRWGYVYALQQAGYGDDVIAKVDGLNSHVGAILDHDENRWSDLKKALAKVENEEWYPALQQSDSFLGLLSSAKHPLWGIRMWLWWNQRGPEPFADRLYDPVPTVDSLVTPSLWVFGGQDSSMPTDQSIRELVALQERGRPVQVKVFPEAEHGILLFEGEGAERKYSGYPPEYLSLQVDWVRSQSKLAVMNVDSSAM